MPSWERRRRREPTKGLKVSFNPFVGYSVIENGILVSTNSIHQQSGKPFLPIQQLGGNC